MSQAYEAHVEKQSMVLSEKYPESLGSVFGLIDEITEKGPPLLEKLQRQRRANHWYTINRRAIFLIKPIRKPCVAFVSVNASLIFGSEDVCLHDIFVETELSSFDSAIRSRLAKTAP